MGQTRINPRALVLLSVFALTLAATLLLAPIPQNPDYHDFADERAWLGIPNFLDVASNAPFLMVGVAGLLFTIRRYRGVARLEWAAFFAGVALVTFGSGYYHWDPSSMTLAWDRVPITVAFMALLSALIAETVSPRAGRIALGPAVLLGIASVWYWHAKDDLRFYGWVQYFPLLLIVLLLLLYPGRIRHWRYLLGAALLYGISKALESGDHWVFELSRGIIGGHALKHVSAAAGCLCALAMLRRRTGESVAD